MADGPALNAPSTPSKKSIFKNRPAWATTTTTTSRATDGVDLFSRQDDSLARFKIEEARRRKEKEKKSESRSSCNDGPPRPVKKRRVSEKDESSTDSSSSSESTQVEPLTRRRFTFNRDLLKPLPPKDPTADGTRTSVVIDLDAENTDRGDRKQKLQKWDTRSQAQPMPVVIEGDSPDSDEEISMLAQRARERRQREQNEIKDNDNSGFQAIDGLELASPSKGNAEANPTQNVSTLPPMVEDPVLKIFVHSEIPGTVPLIVQRKLSQRLKEVKIAWCSKNNISDDKMNSISLQWQGRRLYDSSSCRTLGLQVNRNGELYFKGHEQEAGPENAQLDMEAVTPELLEERKRAREQRLMPVEEGKVPQEQDQAEAGIRVVLKSQGQSDYKLIVKPHTPVRQLVDAFRKKRQAPKGGTVVLMFDGDKLQEDQTVQETDLADMDTIEVHIK